MTDLNNPSHLEDLYGPLYKYSDAKRGERIRYRTYGPKGEQTEDDGEILWVCGPGDVAGTSLSVHYIVAPESGGFPETVFPSDVIEVSMSSYDDDDELAFDKAKAHDLSIGDDETEASVLFRVLGELAVEQEQQEQGEVQLAPVGETPWNHSVGLHQGKLALYWQEGGETRVRWFTRDETETLMVYLADRRTIIFHPEQEDTDHHQAE